MLRNLLTLTTTSFALLLLVLAGVLPGCPQDDDDDSSATDDDDVTSDDDDATGDDDDATNPPDAMVCDGGEATCDDSESGTNVGADNNVNGYAVCGLNETGWGAGEVVYEFTALNDGDHTFTLTWTDQADLDLFVFDMCSNSEDDGATCLGFSIEETQEESVTVNADAGSTLYLVVDGWDEAAADFDLATTCPAPGDDDDSAGDDDDSAGDDDDSATGDDDDSATGDDDDDDSASGGDDDDDSASGGDDDDSAN